MLAIFHRRRLRRLFTPLFEGELTAAEAADAQRWIEADRRLAAEYAHFVAAVRAARAMPDVAAPAGFRRDVAVLLDAADEPLRERFSELLDGTLDTAEAAALREVIAQRPGLAAEYRWFERVVAALRALPMVAPPAGLRARVAERIAAEARPRLQPVLRRALAPSAALALLLLGVFVTARRAPHPAASVDSYAARPSGVAPAERIASPPEPAEPVAVTESPPALRPAPSPSPPAPKAVRPAEPARRIVPRMREVRAAWRHREAVTASRGAEQRAARSLGSRPRPKPGPAPVKHVSPPRLDAAEIAARLIEEAARSRVNSTGMAFASAAVASESAPLRSQIPDPAVLNRAITVEAFEFSKPMLVAEVVEPPVVEP